MIKLAAFVYVSVTILCSLTDAHGTYRRVRRLEEKVKNLTNDVTIIKDDVAQLKEMLQKQLYSKKETTAESDVANMTTEGAAESDVANMTTEGAAESDVANMTTEGAAESDVANMTKGGAEESDVANMTTEGAAEIDVANMTTEGAAESDVANMTTEGAAESDVANMTTEGAAESDVANMTTEGAEESDVANMTMGGAAESDVANMTKEGETGSEVANKTTGGEDPWIINQPIQLLKVTRTPTRGRKVKYTVKFKVDPNVTSPGGDVLHWAIYNENGFRKLRGVFTKKDKMGLTTSSVKVIPESNSRVHFTFGLEQQWYSLAINNSGRSQVTVLNPELPYAYVKPREIVYPYSSRHVDFQLLISANGTEINVWPSHLVSLDTNEFIMDENDLPPRMLHIDTNTANLPGEMVRIYLDMNNTKVSGVFTMKAKKLTNETFLEYIEMYNPVKIYTSNMSGPFEEEFFAFFVQEETDSDGNVVQECRHGSYCHVHCVALGSKVTKMTIKQRKGRSSRFKAVVRPTTVENSFYIAEQFHDFTATWSTEFVCEATNEKGKTISLKYVVKVAPPSNES